MKPTLIYIFVFLLLLLLVIYLQKKFCILCNISTTRPKPYSFSRWQLVWWTFIIFASFISVIIASGKIPTFTDSTLILLGIGSLTTISARLIDITDADNAAEASIAQAAVAPVVTPPVAITTTGADAPTPVVVPAATDIAAPVLAQDIKRGNFLLDILSDKNGVSIHRLQAFIFNLVFGVWFIYTSYNSIKTITVNSTQDAINGVLPIITNNNLILLGVSAGLYATLKSTENK